MTNSRFNVKGCGIWLSQSGSQKLFLLPFAFLLLSFSALVDCKATPLEVPMVKRPNLEQGSSGVEVKELQAALKLMGYFTGAVDGVYNESTAIAVSRFQQDAGLKPDGVVTLDTWNRLFPPTPGATGYADTGAGSTVSATGELPAAVTPTNATQLSDLPGDRPILPQDMDESEVGELPAPVAPTNASATEYIPDPRPILQQGMNGSEVAELQERLRDLGFFQGSVTGYFGTQTEEAVKAAQLNYNLEPDGVVGSSTWNALMQ